MKFGINIAYFDNSLGLEKSAEVISRSGFTLLDYTPNLRRDDWMIEAREAMRIFDAYGLKVHQTHAPFNRYGHYGDMHRLCLERCAEATELLGAQFMVAHGDEFNFGAAEFSPEAALEYNHNYYKNYVERAKRCGYKVAFETVFEDWGRRRFSSNADELLSLIRSFESQSAVCCWDFGHSHVSFKNDAPAIIERFGSLIQCTHLHDNAGNDSHQLPLTGDIDWKATVGALKKIGYSGALSIEYAHGKIPAHLAEEFIDLTYKSAKYIWEL